MNQIKIIEVAPPGEVVVDGVSERTSYIDVGPNTVVDLLVDEKLRDKDCTMPRDAVYRVLGNGVISYIYRNQSAYLINDLGKTIQVIWTAVRN